MRHTPRQVLEPHDVTQWCRAANPARFNPINAPQRSVYAHSYCTGCPKLNAGREYGQLKFQICHQAAISECKYMFIS